MEEIWKDVAGYEGIYEISTHGRVKSHHNWGGKDRIIKPQPHEKGYHSYRLCKKGVRRKFRAHRLVYVAFIGPIPPELQINHINGIKTDNRPENLEVVDARENSNHALRTGLNKCHGENSTAAKLTNADVFTIRSRNDNGESCVAICKDYPVGVNTIRSIVARTSWKYI